jgi:hypothetical protein
MKPNLYCGLNLDKRANRRLTVVLMYIGFVLVVATYAVGPAYHTADVRIHALRLASYLSAFALSVLTYVALCKSMKAYSFDEYGKDSPETDERQAHIRDRSFVISYWILASIVSFALIYSSLAPDWNWPSPTDFVTSNGFVTFALLFTGSLPTVVVAWKEPGIEDEPGDFVTAEPETGKAGE